MKRILVTGAAGYLGSHTCLKLVENGYEVYGIDSLTNGHIESIKTINFHFRGKIHKEIKFIKLDLLDYRAFEDFFENFYSQNIIFDGVIHFAGLKSVANSINNPILYWENNLNSTLNLLKVMSKFEVNSLVFSSSATVYSQINKSPLSENSVLGPINPYGETKLANEKLLTQYLTSTENNFKVASLRYFNPIGAHTSSLIGECNKEEPNNIFPLLCDVAYGNREVFKVFGNDWPTKDGTCIRDYIHVMDLADAHLKALKHLTGSENKHIILNVGTGKGTSVLELINTFQEANKVNINYTFAKRRKGDMPEVFADPTLALNTLNWSAKRELKEMCIDGWQWQVKNPKGYCS